MKYCDQKCEYADLQFPVTFFSMTGNASSCKIAACISVIMKVKIFNKKKDEESERNLVYLSLFAFIPGV